MLLDDALLNVYQHRAGLAQSRSCECGLGIDDVEHFLLQCTLHDDLHHVLKQIYWKYGKDVKTEVD